MNIHHIAHLNWLGICRAWPAVYLIDQTVYQNCMSLTDACARIVPAYFPEFVIYLFVCGSPPQLSPASSWFFFFCCQIYELHSLDFRSSLKLVLNYMAVICLPAICVHFYITVLWQGGTHQVVEGEDALLKKHDVKMKRGVCANKGIILSPPHVPWCDLTK